MGLACAESEPDRCGPDYVPTGSAADDPAECYALDGEYCPYDCIHACVGSDSPRTCEPCAALEEYYNRDCPGCVVESVYGYLTFVCVGSI